MTRALQAFGILATVLTSATVGFIAGVVLMARHEGPASQASPPRWERSL